MIRINLLGAERKQARKAPAFDLGQRLTVACSLILVAAVVGIGWWYWALNKDSDRVDSEIAAAQQDAARLQSLLAEVQRFEACSSSSSFGADRPSRCSCSITSAGAFRTCCG
jgi:uncharacterized protein HemX